MSAIQYQSGSATNDRSIDGVTWGTTFFNGASRSLLASAQPPPKNVGEKGRLLGRGPRCRWTPLASLAAT